MSKEHDSFSIPEAIDAECRVLDTTAGRVAYYADTTGGGRPLVLVHSINACASAKEMQPIFEAERGARPVFAIDLPGFGRSERGDRAYTPALMAEALLAVLRDVAPQGADVVALSLGSEIAALAATLSPDLVHALVVISPTGLGARRKALPKRERSRNIAAEILGVELIGKALFAALRTRASVRYYLGKSFVGAPDPNLVDYAVISARAPGARFAPIAFLSGSLFTPDALHSIYDRVSCPVLVLYDQDPYVDFAELRRFLVGKPRWHAQRIAGTLGLPHFERGPSTRATIDAFLDDRPVETELAPSERPRALTTPTLSPREPATN